MGIARRCGLGSVAAPILIGLALAGCGSAASRASSTTSQPPVTVPTSSEPADLLSRSGTHDLPQPPLGGSASQFAYVQAGDAVVAWGARKSMVPGTDEPFEPIDVGAILDPHSLKWAKLATAPFEHPTANPQLVASSSRVVVVGNSCDVTAAHQPPGSLVADCALGSVQAASFDRRSSRWTLLPVPDTATGYVRAALAVGDRVLVRLGDPATGDDRFGLLDPEASTWSDVAMPATGQPEVVCASKGTAFAVNTRVVNRGVWSELNGATASNDGYGRDQVSTLGPHASAWSAPGQPANQSGADTDRVGCVGGTVLLVADHNGRPSEAWISTGDGGWTPVVAPPADPVPGISGQLAMTPLDRDQVSLDGPVAGGRIFDGSTHLWVSESPSVERSSVGVHLGPSDLHLENDQLVAVTP